MPDELRFKAAAQGPKDPVDEKAQSLFVQKIIDNVQIHLSNVHIRFEDTLTGQTSAVIDESKFFALGVTIDKLAIGSAVVNPADGSWREQFVETPTQLMNKLVKLGEGLQGSGFAVYCNAGEQPIADPGSESWRQRMQYLIQPKKFADDGADYIIAPISATVQATIDKSAGKIVTHPKTQLTRLVTALFPITTRPTTAIYGRVY